MLKSSIIKVRQFESHMIVIECHLNFLNDDNCILKGL